MSELQEITFQLDDKASTQINKIYAVSLPIHLLKKWAETQSMPGFRSGKVPLRLLKKDEFLKHHLSYLLDKIKKKDNIDSIFASNYVVNKFDYDSDVELTLSIEKIPIVPSVNFRNIEVKTFKPIITEENVKTGIENYSYHHSKAGNEVSRASQIGDFVDLDLEIKDLKENHVEKKQQTVKLGTNTFIPLIESALVGQNIGYTFSHNANQNIVINMEIKAIKESIPLTHEEIIEKLHIEGKSIEEFFKERITLEANSFANNLILETIKKIIVDSDFEVPLSSIQREYKKVLNQTLANLNYVKELSLEEFIKNKLGITLKEFEANLTNIAAAHAKIRFMYYTIAKKENLRIEEHEVNSAINSQMRFFNNNIEQTKKFYDENEEAKEEILENILFSKISNNLIHQVKKSEPEQISLDELYKINVHKLEYNLIKKDNEVTDNVYNDKISSEDNAKKSV